MQITLKIQRYNPDTDEAPYYQEYTVEVDPNARLLDALMDVKRFQDGSLGFQKELRSRRLRFGRHAHQWPGWPGLQDAGQRGGERGRRHSGG